MFDQVSSTFVKLSSIYIFKNCSGIVVAPGFGERGINGKLTTIEYARTKNIPFFGICLGMQMAVVEYARNVLGFKNAQKANELIQFTERHFKRTGIKPRS